MLIMSSWTFLFLYRIRQMEGQPGFPPRPDGEPKPSGWHRHQWRSGRLRGRYFRFLDSLPHQLEHTGFALASP